MRLCLLMIFAGTLSLHAAGYSQVLELKVDNASLEEVMNVIRSKTEYSFFFDDAAVSKISNITLDVKNATVEEVLKRCLENTGFSFRVLDKTIILYRDRSQTQQPRSPHVIKGKVTDEQGRPMSGATVTVKGTTSATSSDVHGDFVVTPPVANGTLVFSFVGYKNKEVAFTGQTNGLTVRMEVDVQVLDEVHVVAYGTTTRREATGAISVIKAEEFKDIPSANIANLLQGRVAGMDITNLTGAPGGGDVAMTVRGYNSLDIEQGRRFSNPLWVVDGVPLNTFSSPITGTNLLSDLNPDMIESVQILKDASSASIYGSRAANGVIIVTTKKGSEHQKATFSANVSHTWSILPRLPDVTIGRAEGTMRMAYRRNNYNAYVDPETNRWKYPASLREQYEHNNGTFDAFWYPNSNNPLDNDGNMYQDSLNSFYNNSTNFFPFYFETGKVTNANLQAYGGSKTMTYGVGLGFYDESGAFKGTGFQRIDLNSNMRILPVEKLVLDLRFNGSIAHKQRATSNMDGGLGEAPNLETIPGEPYSMSSLLPGKNSVVWDELLELYSGTKEANRTVHLRANIRLGYQLFDGMEISSSLATDYSIMRRNTFTPSYLSKTGRSLSVGETGINLMVLNENLISYQKLFGSGHSIQFVGGFSYQYDQAEYNGGTAQASPSDKIYYAPPGMPVLGKDEVGSYASYYALQSYMSDMQEKALMSWFARAEYNYKQKYLFSVSFRRDGSSTFGVNNRWGTFPAVAAGWNFSEEPFIQNALPWLSFGKIRASWGRSGMHFAQNYLALGIMSVGTEPYMGQGVLEPVYGDGLYNDALSWEETDQYDFGLDLDFFNHRLSITADYYYRYTDQLLNKVYLPGRGHHTRYVQQWRNAAAVSNEGIELLVKYDIIRTRNIFWRVSANISRNWNRLERTNTGKDMEEGTQKRVIGKALNGIYALKTNGFVDSEDQLPLYYNQQGVSSPITPNGSNSYYFKPGDYMFVDTNGDRMINNGDNVYCGSALPKLSGGIVSSFRWRNFDLNVLFSYQLGRHMVNTVVLNSLGQIDGPLVFDIDDVTFWEKPGDNPKYPKYQYGNSYQWQYNDRNVEKVNWIKLKTITLGYDLNQPWMKKAGFTELRIFASAENLFTLTNYSGMDPETVDIRTGIDNNRAYPLVRKLTLGLTLKF